MWFPGLVDPIPEPELNPKPSEWARQHEQVVKHLEALRNVISMPLPPAKGAGSGILYVGGGPYWPGIVIGVRLLREMGCNLPIQVWHRGDDEPIDLHMLNGLGGVTAINSKLFAQKNGGARILRGWEQKLLALAHCGWERVLYLDADAYCVERPEPLLEQLDRAPFVFWEDMSHNQTTIRWETVWPAGANGVPPVQGGQLMIDRVKAWRLILAAHWMNQHSDFYYQHMFGDQDTWRVVLSALGDPTLWHNLGKAPWQNTAFVCGLADGKTRVVHRCQGKLMRIRDIPKGRQAYNSPQWVLPKEKRVFEILTEMLRHEQGAPAEVFGEIYSKDLWAGGASSGAGSIGSEATAYAGLINTLVRFCGAQSVVDLGCGDGRVGSLIDAVHYVGIDCHGPHIERLKKEQPNREWACLDFFRDRSSIPSGDVLLCKDVLHHWPNEWVVSFLKWIISEKRWKKCFFTQDLHQHADGQDTHLGGYRALNPVMSPLRGFNLQTVVPYHHKACLMLEP